MPQTPCSNLYFPAGDSALLSASQTFINVATKGLPPAGYDITATRPFIPFVGVDASRTPLTILSNKNNRNTFVDWFKAAWIASRRYAQDDLTGLDHILNGNDNLFAGYLYKKLETDIFQQDRYFYISQLIWNFWLNADLAWTAAQYEDELNKFVSYLILTADANLYLAPAQYEFLSAAPTPNDSGLGADILTWKTADPAFAGFGAIEIYF